MSAIILDGQLKSALAVVRSLGQRGVVVAVGAERSTGMSLHSKYTHAPFVYPSPYTDETKFIEEVIRQAIRIGNRPVVYAFSDATYLALFAHREALVKHMILVFPEVKSVEIAFDKAATYSLARVSGVPTITTHTPESSNEIQRLGETLTYPAVLKTRKSVTRKNGVGIFGSASFVQNAEELTKNFFELKEKTGESPLVQDFIRGEEYGVEMLVDKGKVFARITHHRIRSLSPTGGASVLKETLPDGALKSMLERYAEKLVEALSWSGPLMVEFKVDSDTREPKLMEINGRFWGSLPLSVIAGVDIPFLYYQYALEEVVPPQMVIVYAGAISNHFLGDVMHLVRVLFRVDPMRAYVYPTRMQAVRDFCMLPLGTKPDVFSVYDIKPSIMEVIDALQKLWK